MQDIKSLVERPLASDDLDTILHIINASERQSPVPIVTTRSDLVKEFEEPDHALATDTLGLVDGNGEMVAFMRSLMRPDPTRERVAMVTGRVLPEWTRLGLGRRLIQWAIDRSRARLREHSDELPQLIRAYVYEEDTGAVRAFEACGFTPERYFVELTRDLAQPPSMDDAADGVEITTWSPGVDEAVRVTHNAAFLDHWGSEPLSETRWNRWISGNESFLPKASFVAQADGEVVGYSVNFAYPEEWEGIGHSEGWIGGLGTTRDWRKKGVASALIEASLEAFRALGYDRVALGVDSENPTGALGLYPRLGFVPARRELSYSIRITQPEN